MNTKKGDILEALVCMIEKSLQTNPDTAIHRKHRIKDRHDTLREHDVYVETNVNNKLLKYSYECKAFGKKTPIKMSHIAEFYDKIQETDIKGIFISNGRFQKNAIKKAKQLRIEVYEIKIGGSSPSPISELKVLSKNLKVKSKTLGIQAEHYVLHQRGELRITHLYDGPKKDAISLDEFTIDFDTRLVDTFRKNLAKFYARFIQLKDNFLKISTGSFIQRGEIDIQNLFYKVDEGYFPVSKILFEVEVSHEEAQLDTSKYNTLTNLITGEKIVDYFAFKTESFGQDILINFIKARDKELKSASIDPFNFDANSISFKDNLRLTAFETILD